MTWFAFIESNTTGTGRAFCAAAVARGFVPIVLCVDPGRYPYLATDGIESVVVNTRDRDAVLAVCARLAEEHLVGLTSSSEYFVTTAAVVAAKLGLPGPDVDALSRCRDKGFQRRTLSEAGVPVPDYRIVRTESEAAAAAADIGLPVVVKPTDGSGSVGVRLCHHQIEAREWAAGLLRAGVNERGMPMAAEILVEQYVEGLEFSVETFDDTVIDVVGKHLGDPPFFVETGHDVPAGIPPRDRAALAEITRSVLLALGMGWGAAHTEVRMSAAGPVVIEVNPRLAGGMIPVVIQAAYGVDLIGSVIARASGMSLPSPQPGPGSGAIRFALAEREGTVTRVSGVDSAERLPGVRRAGITVRVGDQVTITHSFRDRVGYAVAVAADLDTAVAQAEAGVSRLTIDVSNC